MSKSFYKDTTENPGDFLDLDFVLTAEPYAAARGVSEVARATGGFMRIYESVDGDADALESLPVEPTVEDGQTWMQKRNGFVSRHMRQIEERGEPLFDDDGEPTRRHWSLVMWAYSPDPDGVMEWIEEQEE